MARERQLVDVEPLNLRLQRRGRHAEPRGGSGRPRTASVRLAQSLFNQC